jgi:hypothetical protein
MLGTRLGRCYLVLQTESSDGAPCWYEMVIVHSTPHVNIHHKPKCGRQPSAAHCLLGVAEPGRAACPDASLARLHDCVSAGHRMPDVVIDVTGQNEHCSVAPRGGIPLIEASVDSWSRFSFDMHYVRVHLRKVSLRFWLVITGGKSSRVTNRK